jgi:hypothetical protein
MGADAGGSATTDAALAPLVCTSGTNWNGRTGQTMRPGETCPSCHRRFTAAGTVYPTGREPNRCNGVDGPSLGMTVVITDATGKVLTLPVNRVGNFFTTDPIAKPFRAKVVAGDKVRIMALPQMIGACNSCHTQNGANLAPGRIMAPQ